MDIPASDVETGIARGMREMERGGERTRTADFYVANVALYQLSYTPGRSFEGTKATSTRRPVSYEDAVRRRASSGWRRCGR